MTDRRKEETKLQRAILNALAGIGAWAIRIGRMKSRPGFPAPESGEDGIPDLMVLLPSGTAFLEVKMPGKTLDPDQVTWHAKAKRFGVRAAVAHSVREACEVVQRWRAEGGAR
jgi:hypothetical protein